MDFHTTANRIGRYAVNPKETITPGETETMENAFFEGTLLSLMIGLGLSAACGFRVFVPLLVMNLAVRAEALTLAPGFEWIGSTPALVAFGAATLLEVGGYYLPVIDNLLDAAATPSAVVAGVLTTASQIHDMHPFLAWGVAIIAGGGAAGVVQGLTTITRQLSTLATGGLGNPFFSTFEAGASISMTLLAIFVPFLAAFGFLVITFLLFKKLAQRRGGSNVGAEDLAPAA